MLEKSRASIRLGGRPRVPTRRPTRSAVLALHVPKLPRADLGETQNVLAEAAVDRVEGRHYAARQFKTRTHDWRHADSTCELVADRRTEEAPSDADERAGYVVGSAIRSLCKAGRKMLYFYTDCICIQYNPELRGRAAKIRLDRQMRQPSNIPH